MAKSILSANELSRLADVIGEVEEKTCGEIRVMIVKRSAVSGHVRALLWSSMVSLAVLSLMLTDCGSMLWDHWWFGPGLLVVLFVLSTLLARLEFIQRLLTHHHDLHHQVWARAEVEFHREGLSDTVSHTGVLIFVSLFERQAVVLADHAIADKVPPHTWDKVVATVIAGARTGRWAEKLELAIRECGTYLAAHFPPIPGKGNELPNTVIVKD